MRSTPLAKTWVQCCKAPFPKHLVPACLLPAQRSNQRAELSTMWCGLFSPMRRLTVRRLLLLLGAVQVLSLERVEACIEMACEHMATASL
eukprot:COSAG01_NODE_56997_length_315_cov_0.703704_1_plen_90_part_00